MLLKGAASPKFLAAYLIIRQTQAANKADSLQPQELE